MCGLANIQRPIDKLRANYHCAAHRFACLESGGAPLAEIITTLSEEFAWSETFTTGLVSFDPAFRDLAQRLAKRRG